MNVVLSYSGLECLHNVALASLQLLSKSLNNSCWQSTFCKGNMIKLCRDKYFHDHTIVATVVFNAECTNLTYNLLF